MLIDNLLSTRGKALSGLGTSAFTTLGEVIDLGPNRNQGFNAQSDKGGWAIYVNGATSAGASTLSLRLVTSATAALGSPVVLWSVSGITLAQAVKHRIWLPVPDSDEWLRYMAFQGQAGTAVFTGGTFAAEFAAQKPHWRAYPAETGR